MSNVLDCPHCSHPFANTRGQGQNVRHSNYSRFPLLLMCGHSVCENCLTVATKLHKYYKCPICNHSITDLEEGTTKLTSGYLLNKINNKGRKPQNQSYLVTPELKKSVSSDESTASCNECRSQKATWNCPSCCADFCSSCWDVVHKNIKYMKKHKGKSLLEDFSSSDLEVKCKAHKQALDFYCNDDDELACSYCAVMGPHIGHALVLLSEKMKNEDHSGNLKESISLGVKVWNRLKYTQKEIATIQSETRQHHTKLKNNLQMQFSRLHGLLEIREQELQKQLHDYCTQDMGNLEEMLTTVNLNVKKVFAMIKDGNKAISNQKTPTNAFLLEKKLQACKDFPTHVIPACYPSHPDPSIVFDPVVALLQDDIVRFGKFELNKNCWYALKDEENLPENYEQDCDIDGILDDISDDDGSSTISDNMAADNDCLSQSSKSEKLSVSSVKSNTTQKSNGSQLKLITPDPMKYFHDDEIHVIHIVNPSEFWVRRSKDVKSFNSLSDQLNKHRKYHSEGNIPKTATVGELYVAQYDRDKLWYRARVKSILPSVSSSHGNEMVVVFFIDFGNSQKIPKNKLRKIVDPKLLQYPALAWQCKLYDLQAPGDVWGNDASKMFYRLAANKSLIMKVMEKTDDGLVVDLFQSAHSGITDDKVTSIRDSIVFLGHGRFASNPTEFESLSITKKKIENEKSPLPGNSSMVALCHIDNVSSFFVQKLGAKSKQLQTMMNDLQSVNNSRQHQSLNLLCPARGVHCAAKFSSDNKWYRAVIVSDVENSNVKVRYVDFGNTEEVDIWNLRKLMDKHMALPAQAIHCALADVGPENIEGEWSVEASHYLSGTGGNRKLKMIVKEQDDDFLYVTLHIMGEEYDINLNSSLVKKGFAVSTGPSSLESNDIVYHTNHITNNNSGSPPRAVNNSTDVPEFEVENSRRARNKKLQNLRKKEISKQMVAKTSPPNIVAVPIKPEHETVSSEVKPKSKKSEYIPIMITHVQSPSLLHFRLKPELTDQADELAKMMHDIQVEYSSVVETGSLDWNVSDVCCVKSLQDGLWYRATITEAFPDEELFKVLLVDYGQTQTVPMSNLSILQKEFQVLEAFAIASRLVGITPAGDGKKWSNMACEYLTELTEKYESELYFIHNKKAEKINGSLAVDLYIQEIIVGGALEPTKKAFINVAKKLIDEGLALPAKMESMKKKRCEVPVLESSLNDSAVTEVTNLSMSEDCSTSTSEDLESNQIPPELLEMCQLSWKPSLKPTVRVFKCRPTYVDNHGQVWLYDSIKGENHLRVLRDAMQMRYSNSKPQAHDLYWCTGQICIAKYCHDEKWYRAQVLSVQDGVGVKVRFVDYGNEEIVSCEDLRKDVIMTELPCQSICCSLYGVAPISEDGKWPLKVAEFIHKTVVDKLCAVTVENFPVKDQMPKISLTIDPDMSLQNILFDAKCAMEKEENDVVIEEETYLDIEEQKLKKFPTPYVPEVDEVLPVIIAQLISPFQVAIQKFELKDESTPECQRFKEIMTEMSEKAKDWSHVSNVEKGHICCGQYIHDDTWYRAEVLEVMEEDQYLVRYVDYGNCEIITADRMRVLPQEIIDFPVQAIICNLHQLTYCETKWTKEISAKMMNIFFDSKFSFYAKIKSKDPEVKIDVMIKDEDGNFTLAYQSLIDDGIIALVREKLPQEYM